jgi:Uncharacterized protein conserved in bacteria
VSQQEVFAGPEFAQTQWRAQSMQLVNWGGLGGPNTIEFSAGTTLISGASGTGKSTILDAYLALMMDSNTPFNGASNDAARGRARGATQRSLLTYLRGKLDDVRDDGEATERTLRGANTSTWGAIAVTFVDDVGERLTVGRLYYVPRSAARDTDIAKRMWSIPGTVALKEFEPLAADKFEKKALRSRWPRIQVHDTYDAFAATLQTRLGIGSHGDPSSALRLLTRVQAGKPVAAVDDLYKQMVLETPSTFTAADAAIEHFADLETAYQEMVDASDQEAILAPIADLVDAYTTALGEVARIDGYGLNRAESPGKYWTVAHEQALVSDAVHQNELDRGVASVAELTAKDDEGDYKEIVSLCEEAIAAAGGAELTKLDETINELGVAYDAAVSARDAFDVRTAELGTTIATEADYFAAKTAAAAFIPAGYDEALRHLDTERLGIQRQIWELEGQITALVEERESLEGRAGRVPHLWHQQRLEAAAAAGLDPDQLPFVAELIDVPVEHAGWRTAVEVVFNPVARVMLVEDTHRNGLSRAINDLRWKTRIPFEGVDLEPFVPAEMSPAMLSGKLDFKDTQFTGWIQRRLTERGLDALCVDQVDELDGGGRRVTRTGQIRQGRSGAHGGSRQPIIGFDNKDRLEEIDSALGTLGEERSRLDPKLAEINEQARQLLATRDAHQYVTDTDWASIDHATIDARIAKLVERKTEILDSNTDLERLEQERTDAIKELEDATERRYEARAAIKQLEDGHRLLTEHRTELDTQLSTLATGGHGCSEEQAATLAKRFETVGGVGAAYSQDAFEQAVIRLVGALSSDRQQGERDANNARARLEDIFVRFDEKWPNPNRGTSIESYPDYLRIRDEITASGLHERREIWIRKLTDWTGEDLVPLNGEFDNAIEDIQDRLAPVNQILRTLPFGAHHDRLRIDLRKLTRDDQSQFRRELRDLSSGATGDLTIDQAEAKFARLKTFMGRIRNTDEKSRAYHLDVRKHIELSASVITDDGSVRAEYTSLGEKSGGETQELVAFIVGSALRFQLGDETKTRPRFAPVFLDEGFVKADSEFAGRGVRAWKGLGFQLIVAAPFDKVTALEPHVEQVLLVTKNPTTGHARIDDITHSASADAETRTT